MDGRAMAYLYWMNVQIDYFLKDVGSQLQLTNFWPHTTDQSSSYHPSDPFIKHYDMLCPRYISSFERRLHALEPCVKALSASITTRVKAILLTSPTGPRLDRSENYTFARRLTRTQPSLPFLILTISLLRHHKHSLGMSLEQSLLLTTNAEHYLYFFVRLEFSKKKLRTSFSTLFSKKSTLQMELIKDREIVSQHL